MKKLCLLIPVLLSGLFVFAQQVLIPYKSGNKYGLCDQHRKILVKPAYDEIKPLKGEYFQYTNTLFRKDSVRSYDGGWNVRESRVYDGGVFFRDKLLLKNKDYPYFFILSMFIIGSENQFRPEYCELYNLKGETLIPGPVKAIGINDERDFGELANYAEQFSLISIFKRAEKDLRMFSAAVYDNKAGKIVKWLLKDVVDYRLSKMVTGPSFALCSYKDQTGKHEAYIRFDKNQYFIQPKDAVKPGDLPYDNNDRVISREMGDPAMIPDETAMKVDVSMYEGNEKNAPVMYQSENDGQLTVSVTGQKKVVQLPPGSTFIFSNEKVNFQHQSVLIKNGKQFRILSMGELQEPVYDTLLYLDKQFLAGKIMDGKMRYGILNDDGTVNVPFLYDSIPGNISNLASARVGDYKTLHDTILVKPGKEDYSFVEPSAYQRRFPHEVLVFKDGKAGLLNRLSNSVLLKVEYDLVANNTLSFLNNFNTEFIIVKKNGRYGVGRIDSQKGKTPGRFDFLTGLVFDHIPGYYINDYYEVNGYRLFALYNSLFEFIGYADKQGNRFYN